MIRAKSGKCVCPPETKEVKVKNKKTGKVDVTCACNDSNKVLKDGKCVDNKKPVVKCKSPMTLNKAGKCVCPADTEEVQSKNRSTGKVETICECRDKTKTLKGGKCVADDGPSLDTTPANACFAPRKLIGGQCKCPGDQMWYDPVYNRCWPLMCNVKGKVLWTGSECQCINTKKVGKGQGWVFNPVKGQCNPPCYGKRHINRATDQCECVEKGTVWNYYNDRCVVPCFSPRELNKAGKCVCPQGAKYNPATNKCLRKDGKVKTTRNGIPPHIKVMLRKRGMLK